MNATDLDTLASAIASRIAPVVPIDGVDIKKTATGMIVKFGKGCNKDGGSTRKSRKHVVSSIEYI